MPKLLPATRKIREKRFLKALEKTGSTGKAALEVLNIGSKGSENIIKSASAAGSQMLARIRPTMRDALEENGVTADKLAKKTNRLLDDENPLIIDKGITQAAKFGVGEGYAAEKSINMNVNVNPEAMDKYKDLREEYEKKLLDEIAK